jgi:Kef-type K+ transport system membrane component KefB
MRMRESIRSLRAYFVVIGLFFGAQGVITFVGEPLGPADVVSMLNIALALAYVYVGVRLRHLLVTSPKQIIVVVLVSAVPCGIGLIASLLAASIPGIFWCTVQLLITWYLYANVSLRTPGKLTWRLTSRSTRTPRRQRFAPAVGRRLP